MINVTPLHLACENGHTESARLLIDAGADPHAMDLFKCTPLMNAMYNGSVDSFLSLLEFVDIDESRIFDCFHHHIMLLSPDDMMPKEIVKVMFEIGILNLKGRDRITNFIKSIHQGHNYLDMIDPKTKKIYLG
jgi:ankyrin repeat protein